MHVSPSLPGRLSSWIWWEPERAINPPSLELTAAGKLLLLQTTHAPCCEPFPNYFLESTSLQYLVPSWQQVWIWMKYWSRISYSGINHSLYEHVLLCIYIIVLFLFLFYLFICFHWKKKLGICKSLKKIKAAQTLHLVCVSPIFMKLLLLSLH